MYIRFLCIDSLVMSIGFCINGFINGAGKTLFTMIISLVSAIILRVPLAYLFALTLNMGVAGIGLAAGLSPIATLVIGFIYYKSGRWKKARLIKEQ